MSSRTENGGSCQRERCWPQPLWASPYVHLGLGRCQTCKALRAVTNRLGWASLSLRMVRGGA